jgi:hypothetical protein
MLRIDSVRSFVRSLLVREVRVEVPVPVPVEVRVEVPVEVERVVERRVEVPAPAPAAQREYWILESHKSRVIQTGTAVGDTEFACLHNIYALHGERVQFSNGGRYRCHADTNGRTVFTRIDKVRRATAGQRAAHRNARLDRAEGGIAGE